MSTLIHVDGWYQTNTEGVPTVYLSITDEGLTTHPSDTPSNVQFRPRILNPQAFSIRRRPIVWPWGDSSIQAAAFGRLDIDNYDGAFDFLLNNDLRDATVVIQLPVAAAFGNATTMSSAVVVATCVLDDATMDTEDVVSLSLKDTLARWDRPLMTYYNPPFVESDAAGRMCPLTFGACRNVAPLLIDSTGNGTGKPIYQLHDAAISNITAARDMGALLDANATPPQWVPAISNSGIQLQTNPVGKFLVDCSSVGSQSSIPGVADVFGGVGNLLAVASGGVTTWTAPFSTNPPSGFTYTNPGGLYGTFGRFAASNGYPQDWCMSMSTRRPFNPSASDFGLPTTLTGVTLAPGRAYRITITLDRAYFPNGDTTGCGLYVTLDATTRSLGISGSSWGPYLTVPGEYSFYINTPNDGVSRTVSVVAVGNPIYASDAIMVWHGLRAELLGQYTELPMQGISLEDYWKEILYLRAFEDTASWSASDLAAIDDATGYTFGVHYDDTPNILTAIRDPLDSFCAAVSTDALGVARVGRLIDPTDPAGPAIVADFSPVSVERPISVVTDRASMLTTLIGAVRNWSISNPSDFVSDFDAVPPDVRARYQRVSQYQCVSGKTPAGQYSFAIGAPVFDSLLDTRESAQTEIDRVVAIYSPRVYSNGVISNGKRHFVTFTVYFDDANMTVGETVTTQAQNILFGQIVSLTYPRHGFNNTRIMVAGTELFPFAQKLIIYGFY